MASKGSRSPQRADRSRAPARAQVLARVVDGPGVTLGGISSAHSQALAGLAAGQDRMLGAAESLSSDVSVEGIVDLKSAEVQIKASTAAI